MLNILLKSLRANGTGIALLKADRVIKTLILERGRYVSDALYQQRVKEVLSRHVVTINAKDSVHDSLELMTENRVSTLPVVDRRGRCVGILSISDLIEMTRDIDAGLTGLEDTEKLLWDVYFGIISQGVGHQSVMDLMSDKVASVSPESLLWDAASLMLREHVHRLPVIDENNRLIGIISMTDILSAFVECKQTS